MRRQRAHTTWGICAEKVIPIAFNRLLIMGAHDGHRNRVREKVARIGIEAFEDHEVLEYILFHFVPMRNTNEIAHALIDKFGSFADVLNADAERLCEVPGMTYNADLFLSVLPDILRRYAVSAEKKRVNMSGRRKVRDYLAKEMFGTSVEVVGAVALDAQDGMIRFEKLSAGTGDGVNVSVRKVVDFAMRTNAVSLVLAHNHPGGNAGPSQQDVELTREIAFVLASIGVTLLDHIIYTDTESFSFDENGLLDDIFAGGKR